MNIVCLIRASAPTVYFVNKIHSFYPISEVIVESPSIISKIKKHGVKKSLIILIKKIINKKDLLEIYRYWFSDQWRSINKNIKITYVENINSDIVFERVKKIKTDLLLDHGTSIVKKYIIEQAGLALNLHWGLSPYYRGTHCTDWALINWDINNIGVTIHKLVRDIDGGDILAQDRAAIKDNDTLDSINCQLTFLGTELILKIINKLKNNERLYYVKQDYSLGFMTCLRQWTPMLDKQVKYIEDNKLIENMLSKPARKEKMPIIYLK